MDTWLLWDFLGVSDFIFIFSKAPKLPSFTFLSSEVFLAGGFTLAVCLGVFFFFELFALISTQKCFIVG